MSPTRKQLGDREDLYLQKAQAAADKAREAQMANPPRWIAVNFWQGVEKRHRDRAWQCVQQIAALYQGI